MSSERQSSAKLAQAYKRVFDTEDGKLIEAHLRRFCRADETTFTPDDPNGRVTAFKEGRREVWLEIQKRLAVPMTKLVEIINEEE